MIDNMIWQHAEHIVYTQIHALTDIGSQNLTIIIFLTRFVSSFNKRAEISSFFD